MARLAFLDPLRHRPFRVLFLGQVISNLGDWLNLLALSSLLLYRWNLGAGAWGAVLIALTLPSAILGPAAGVLVDRWPRKPVMILSDLARALVVLGLVVAPNLPTVLASSPPPARSAPSSTPRNRPSSARPCRTTT